MIGGSGEDKAVESEPMTQESFNHHRRLTGGAHGFVQGRNDRRADVDDFYASLHGFGVGGQVAGFELLCRGDQDRWRVADAIRIATRKSHRDAHNAARL